MDAARRGGSGADRGVIPDALLRQIIGVGQVDLLVGLETCDHARTVGAVVGAVRALLYTFYSRLRVALLHVDRASSDATPSAALDAWNADGRARGTQGLRTTHYMTATADRQPDGDIVRIVLGSADLLQARAVIVVDADVEPVSPGEMAALLAPVWDGESDVVAPAYARGASDGLLLTQLVRPLTRAVFARRLAEPLLPTFACSGGFAAHCAQAAWGMSAEQRATRYWVAAEALIGPFHVRQRAAGPRKVQRGRPQPTLPDVFTPLVASVFACIEGHAEVWLARGEAEDVPLVGAHAAPPDSRPSGDASGLLQSFAEDIRNLDEVLQGILESSTLAAVQAASREPDGPDYPEALWVATVADFLGAFHHGVMRRDHIVQALLPLYRARAGAFLQAHARESAAAVEIALESIGARFESARPGIVQRWTHQREVQHG